MARRDLKARSLSIFLLKPDHSTSDRALFYPDPLINCRVSLDGGEIGELFIKPSSDHAPSWLSLFDGSLNVVPENVRNASTAAVFLTSSGERRFAVVFGYGRSLLRPGAWEEDFGLKVTLNAVDPLKIRSVDRVKFDAISQHSQIQASRDAHIVEFGLDVEQDILRAVTGKPRDATLANQLTGKDALKADVRVNLRGLPELLGRYIEKFGQDTYKEHFSWVDHVAEVRDPTRIAELDGTLVHKLRERDLDRLWLAIPDRIEWEGMAGFKYRNSQKAKLHPDIDFRTFWEEQGEHFAPAIDVLKNRKRVYLISYEADAVSATWSLYRCIYCEVDSGDDTFLLNNGKWYRINSDFLRDVEGSFERVLTSELALPEFHHPDEETYNRSVAEGAPDVYFLMDQRFARYRLRVTPSSSVTSTLRRKRSST